ncbi:DUF4064 domain-containing protein [Curtobacterium flaccumfaciens]|uniref:DUF4064 domain-containing protein n=1 Tax=Curtobacterium flaccumfaciens TaxID=2035 RepID=UPI0039919518
MTNDDRNDQDRTGDGQAPRWGDAPQQQQPDADAPRYGERVDPAPTSTPQYGEQYGQGQQQYGQQQSGQGQQQYGQQQYGQPSSTPSWNDQQRHDQGQHHDQQPYAAAPAHSGAPAWQSHDEPKPKKKKKKKTVGIIAFVLGLLALVLGVVGGYIMGSAISNSGVIDQITQNGSTNLTPEQMQSEVMSDPDVRSQLVGGIAVIGIAAFLGLWALVQGIIAAVAKRGRVWGILAIVLAVVATIATFVTYAGVAAAGAVGANS